MPAEAFKNVLEIMVRMVVDNPDEANVTMRQGEQTTVYTIHCAKRDLGQVLGKQGKMVGSFRLILMAYSAKNKFRAVIEVNE